MTRQIIFSRRMAATSVAGAALSSTSAPVPKLHRIGISRVRGSAMAPRRYRRRGLIA
jgi:hypothetical protein